VKQEWIERPEAGSVFGYKLIRGFAFACGRTASRLLLYPITGYYVLRRGPERRASRAYLTRVLGREPSWWEICKHVFWFASVTLDRVFMLSERFKRFDIRVYGLDELRSRWAQKRGVLILGSHHGSFDALRVLSEFRQDVNMRVVIDLEQNPALSRILNALNPKLAASIINARQEGMNTALAIKEALDDSALVTLLADRARPGNTVTSAQFLGTPAPFPTAPWQMAAALKVPVVLCFGLYRGGNRYDLHFEPFADTLTIERANREASLNATVQRFADRLAHYVRAAPYNWFNFYDFWQFHAPLDPARHDTRVPAAHDARERHGS
jgi:predicted LPLAT superfamily acyltransferase